MLPHLMYLNWKTVATFLLPQAVIILFALPIYVQTVAFSSYAI